MMNSALVLGAIVLFVLVMLWPVRHRIRRIRIGGILDVQVDPPSASVPNHSEIDERRQRVAAVVGVSKVDP